MYANRSDLVLRYGEIEISQLERGLTGGESVNSYIEDASDIADGYIGVIYDVPLSHP
ncbi:MAG: phage protein Gp36 family protein, partial [Acinetobacter sp.]